MLRQSFKKVQVSQNENPNIISKGKDNTENNDENVTKNNFLQTSTASTTINSNSAQLKRHNQSSAELSVLKSVKRERSTILNVSDSETDESSAEPHMHHNMNETSTSAPSQTSIEKTKTATTSSRCRATKRGN